MNLIIVLGGIVIVFTVLIFMLCCVIYNIQRELRQHKQMIQNNCNHDYAGTNICKKCGKVLQSTIFRFTSVTESQKHGF